MLHYQQSATINITINPLLDVYCVGGADPPRNCPSADFQSNAASTACVCRDGFFLNTNDVCQECPKGSFCVGGVRRACPKHTYQTATRATACVNCVATGDELGIYSDCGPGQQLEFCEEGKATPLTENCRPCTRCRKAYLTRKQNTQGEVDCYRSNA